MLRAPSCKRNVQSHEPSHSQIRNPRIRLHRPCSSRIEQFTLQVFIPHKPRIIFPFEYSTAYYQIINHEKADSVIEVNKDNRKYDYGLGNLLNAERNNSLGRFNLIHYVESELELESRREGEIQKMRERQRKEDSIWTVEHPNKEKDFGGGIIDGVHISDLDYNPADYYNLKTPYLKVHPDIEDSVT